MAVKDTEESHLEMELDIYQDVVPLRAPIKYFGHAMIANRDECSCYMTRTRSAKGICMVSLLQRSWSNPDSQACQLMSRSSRLRYHCADSRLDVFSQCWTRYSLRKLASVGIYVYCAPLTQDLGKSHIEALGLGYPMQDAAMQVSAVLYPKRGQSDHSQSTLNNVHLLRAVVTAPPRSMCRNIVLQCPQEPGARRLYLALDQARDDSRLHILGVLIPQKGLSSS